MTFITVNYRKLRHVSRTSGILFNTNRHAAVWNLSLARSPMPSRRQSVSRKNSSSATHGATDWGFAGDYVQPVADAATEERTTNVIGTGEAHTVQEFADLAFAEVGLHSKDYIETDPSLLRPAEVELLIADPSQGEEKLGWKPNVVFPGLVKLMVGRYGVPKTRGAA